MEKKLADRLKRKQCLKRKRKNNGKKSELDVG